MANNIAGDKMFSHMDRIFGEQKPITADIFLTNYCNNKCPYCTYKRWELGNKSHHMSSAEFTVYARRLISLGVKGMILTGGGEPTVNPEFMAIAEWLQANEVHYGVNTNFNKLVYIKPDYLKVSLDGWDEESYEKSRGVRAYQKVRENIKAYAEWKKENSPKTTLGIQRVVSSYFDVYQFYEANKDLPVDYIVFRPVESTSGDFYNNEYSCEDVKRTVEAIRILERVDKRVTLNFKWELLDRQEERCTAQWAQIAVNEYGEVMYCCHKPYQIVGHVMDDDILEKKKKAATDMNVCDIPCRMTAPNMFVAKTKQVRKDACFI